MAARGATAAAGGREQFWDILSSVTDGNSNHQQLVFGCYLAAYGHHWIGCVIQVEGQGDLSYRRRSVSGDGLGPAFLHAGRLFYTCRAAITLRIFKLHSDIVGADTRSDPSSAYPKKMERVVQKYWLKVPMLYNGGLNTWP